uniref:Uncharacterized protein n=1 Tax=Calcidiscus leptoporus TaxID=127549 RepID=A0A7S0J9J3_9EUKA
MARSAQQYTARLFAYALGLNYAYGVEFVELTNGNRFEQRRTKGQDNVYGLHGNALLSRWPLSDAAIVRMDPSRMSALYSSRGFETAFGYEKRLGGRMSLFAITGQFSASAGQVPSIGEDAKSPAFIIGSTHAQTSWGGNVTHTQLSIASMRSHMATMARVAASRGIPTIKVLGGDTWPSTCSWLGLQQLVKAKSPRNALAGRRVRLQPSGMDDYLCADNNVTPTSGPTYFAAAGRPLNAQSEYVLCDHVFVTVTMFVQDQRL